MKQPKAPSEIPGKRRENTELSAKVHSFRTKHFFKSSSFKSQKAHGAHKPRKALASRSHFKVCISASKVWVSFLISLVFFRFCWFLLGFRVAFPVLDCFAWFHIMFHGVIFSLALTVPRWWNLAKEKEWTRRRLQKDFELPSAFKTFQNVG